MHTAPAVGPADWRGAADLLDEYRQWLVRATGLELTVAQSAAGAEFENLRSPAALGRASAVRSLGSAPDDQAPERLVRPPG